MILKSLEWSFLCYLKDPCFLMKKVRFVLIFFCIFFLKLLFVLFLFSSKIIIIKKKWLTRELYYLNGKFFGIIKIFTAAFLLEMRHFDSVLITFYILHKVGKDYSLKGQGCKIFTFSWMNGALLWNHSLLLFFRNLFIDFFYFLFIEKSYQCFRTHFNLMCR